MEESYTYNRHFKVKYTQYAIQWSTYEMDTIYTVYYTVYTVYCTVISTANV